MNRDGEKRPGEGPPENAEIARLLDRKIAVSRAALFWERLWPMLLPPLGVGGAFLALGLLGLWQDLPPYVHVVALGLGLIGIGFTLAPLARLRWPNRDEGRARLDRQSGFAHRPAEGFDDRLGGEPDTTQRLLWETHRRRLMERVRAIPVRAPRPRAWERDPYALRTGVVLALLIGFAYAGPDWWQRAAGTLSPGAVAQSEPARLDAWVTPPTYTGKPPIFIADGAKTLAEITPNDGPITVPAKSRLVLRLHGGDDVAINLADAAGELVPFDSDVDAAAAEAERAKAAASDATKAPGDAVAEASLDEPNSGERYHVLNAPVRLVLTAGETEMVWQFDVVADTPPAIVLAEEFETGNDESLRLKYRATDDYGVVGARVAFGLIPSDEPDQLGDFGKAPVDRSGPRLEVEAPDFDLLLPGSRLREVERNAFKDLTAHPWAGLGVEMVLSARDEIGQIGTSAPERFTMPSRRFRDPMARAVIEQRRTLVATPWRRDRVVRALDALTISPERFIEDFGVYLSLRTAKMRTEAVRTNEHVEEVVDLLWDIALGIEDGDLSLAERELRAAQERLAQALADGASQEEIERLLQELRQALNRFMQAMAEEAMRNAQRQQPNQMNPNQQMVESQDLQRLMDMIEQLARSGANDAAQQLLEQLRNLLENLEGAIAQGQMSPEQGQMSQMLDELGRMIGEQQRLMDETFRQNGQQGQPGQQGQQGQGQQGQGQGQQGQGQQGQGGQGSMSLAERQDALRQQLEQLLDQMRQGGMEVPGSLPRAGGEMGTAEDRLSEGQPGQALGPQGQALDQLRNGARSMAQQLLDGMAAQQGRNNQGQNRPDARTDPLGRPRQSTGPDFGLSVKVPDEIDAETARQLREELQRRLGDRTRELFELDYLERLLRRFGP